MGKTIEDTYKKLTQREHVLERPGMYIGSVKKQNEELWVTNDEMKMEKTVVNYTPGFIKIFDEILTNATDHSFRDDTVTMIKVEYSKETGEISVWNNGEGIPIQLHKDYNIYVPELIFGHLLSGSNYNDTDTRTGAGTNGLGSKAVNIYSKKFIVETIDNKCKKKFIQEFSENMTVKSKAKITSNSGKSYTKITFIPDYNRFDMKGLEEDTIKVIRKRVLDCIACTNNNVQVYMNGVKLKGKGLVDYTKYFFEGEKVISEIHNEKVKGKNGKVTEYVWEYAIVPYTEYEQISFVNGNVTIQGGKHVDYVMYQIINKLKKMIEEKKKIKDIKPNSIKDRMFLFLRATVLNPSFNSQTKEQLTTPSKDFGCTITVSDAYITKIYKSAITEEILEICKIKENLLLSKTSDGKKKNKIYIQKLEDALWAGTQKSDQCTLILTEGESAKTFAMWGRSVVGPEKYGVYSLKGKVLNIRDASMTQLINNEEINNIKQIIGLKQDKVYNNTSELRYGKVMVLTDADTDGSHIKGLLINLFHCWWPNLLKLDKNFIETLKTPIVKAINGKKIIEFYTQQDYDKWEKETSNAKKYEIRYYKGLGTSKKDDAKDTFKRMNELKVEYYYKDKKCDENILLAFQKDKNIKTGEQKCSDKRKEWLSKYDKNSYIDVKENRTSYQDFISKELVHFSIYDNIRSIPSICDGLKPSQRKILHYMLSKNITKNIKVAQLSGYVSAETGYHHGEVSLQQAIINMAQDFIGTNNINLLYPNGSFGSRLMNKDAASPRYIYTYLSDITPYIYNANDAPLLNEQYDDGHKIEPEWYIPIIPMVLVNGCEGIGTGYSTFIPSYNPNEIIDNMNRILDNKELIEMKPYYRGFGGIVQEVEKGSYITKGKWKRTGDNKVTITEIPVGSLVTPYKDYLETLLDDKSNATKKVKRNIILKDVVNKTTDENTGICFEIEFKDTEQLDKIIKDDTIEKELKLIKTCNTNNMYLFDCNLKLKKFNNANDIMFEFYQLRILYYKKRKEYLIKKYNRELCILKSKVKFINEYMNGDLDINRKTKPYIIKLLEERGYNKHEESFDYLIKMELLSLSMERITELENQKNKKQEQLDTLMSKTEKQLWKDDLEILKTKMICNDNK